MTTEGGVVYKYFDLIDGFIRVRVLSADELIQFPSGSAFEPPDRREYRRMVVESCVVGLSETVLPRVTQIYPEDAGAAEDLLYQICVDVNPKLEIHTVALPADASDSEAFDSNDDDEDFRRKAAGLENSVLAEVFGQDRNIEKVSRAVRKAACGLNDPNRPVGTFLLVGRSGTGKTELAKSVARNLFGDDRLIRVDCSEYALPHETAKLIGAPPGYVGHNDGGIMTEALMRNPRSVVLFDEVEKGHEKLHNMLLQILDEGRLTDSKGNTVTFQESIVLLTSNVGTADYAAAAGRVGFSRTHIDHNDFSALTTAAVQSFFRPELLNRLDAILTFDRLDSASCARIAERQLVFLRDRMEKAAIKLTWTNSVAKALAQRGYSEDYGAREVRRTVESLVEEHLATGVLDGAFRPGDEVQLRWRNEDVVFEHKRVKKRTRKAS